MIETHDGAILDIRNFGYRRGPAEVIARLAKGEEVDAGEYYMRTTPRFETGDARYAWLNTTLVIGTGARLKAAVTLTPLRSPLERFTVGMGRERDIPRSTFAKP